MTIAISPISPILSMFVAWLSFMAPAIAEPAATPEVKIVQLENPGRSIGIQIGDHLERRLHVEVAQPYQLSASALPLKGASHDGIELADIRMEKKVFGTSSIYTLTLRYQVFSPSTKAIILQLPAEKIALNGGPKALAVEIPAWRFWFSPLAAADIGLAKTAMQPQAPPSPIALSDHYSGLAAAVACLILGLVGLIYVHADRRWLPFMGGAFASAYREIRRMPRDRQHEPKALLRLHQAFDQVNGASLFAAGIDDFIARYPQFGGARADISAFYVRSGQRLFSGQTGDAHFFEELLALTRRLRHCERGLG
jgi:mxaA protein